MEPYGLTDLGQWMTWAGSRMQQMPFSKTSTGEKEHGTLKPGGLLFPLYDLSLPSFRKEGRRPPRA